MGKSKPISRNEQCLSRDVRESLESYLETLDGHDVCDLYNLFLRQVEKPLFEVVFEYAKGNLSLASKMLGINRATLRSRLKKYELI